MHDIESRALRRALILLLLVSVGRWGWATAGRGASEASDGSELAEFVDTVRSATREAERRGRPLAAGERIDPNRADEIELDRLPGVGPSLAAAIVAAREGGAVFRHASDLAEVRGIGPALVARLGPLLDLAEAPRGASKARGRSRGDAVGRPPYAPIDVNRAAREQLESLPGVGPAIAERILERRRVGPFRTVDDLLEVRGIGPATLARLRPLLSVGRLP